MLKSIAFSLLMVSSYALHGMEQENKQSMLSSLTSKVQSITSSIVSSLKITPKIVKHSDLHLANILQLKLNEIKLLKAGEEIEVTDQATKILEERNIVYYSETDPRKATCLNNKKITIKKTGIYILRNDSKLTNEQAFKRTLLSFEGYHLLTSQIAHHIELYKILEIKNASIFSHYCVATTAGCNLDILYDADDPEKLSDLFELNENNIDAIVNNPGFKAHEKRIKDYTLGKNLQNASIANLLLLQRK
jgi:hypothetical protein